MLYNVPSRTSLNMTNDTTVRLSQIENIIGIKEASSDPVQIAKVIRDTADDFRVWSGNDDETFPIMSMGGYGVVSVAAHLVGTQIKQMMGLVLEGDVEAAGAEHLRLLDMFKGLFIVSNPIPVKYGLNRVGFNVGDPRLPLVPPDDRTAEQLDELLDRYEIDITAPAD
jgi:4-hydroxy-tetrahydrodipicolinate synthase